MLRLDHFILALVLVLLASTACSAKKGKSGGVVDGGGGGDLRLHSREEAIKEIQNAWSLLVTTRPDNPIQVAAGFLNWRIYAARATWNRGEPLTDQESQIRDMLIEMLGSGGNRPAEQAFGRYVDTKLSKNLKDKKLKLIEAGLCKGPSHSGHIASVSKLDFTGEVCVSIREVQKMPYSGVTSTPLIALLIHEIAHLHGHDETRSALIQDFFLRNMPAIMGYRDEQKKSKISAQADFKIRGIREFLYIYKLDANYVRGLQRLASEMRAIQDSLPEPYSVGSLPEHSPEKFEKLYREIGQIGAGYNSLAESVNARLKRNKNRPPPKDAATLARVRELALRSVQFLDSLNLYLFGSKDPMERAGHELDTENFPLSEEEIISKTGG